MLEFGDGPFDVEVWIALAIATLVMPVVFLIVVGVAAQRRGRTGTVGPATAAAVALTGGLTLGTLITMSGDLTLLVPVLGAGVLIAYSLRRRGRKAQAGWLLAGLALPSVFLWSYAASLLVAGRPFDPVVTLGWLALSIVALGAGVTMIRRGDPLPPAPDIRAPAGQPGSRSYGSIAEAIREPSRVGPFGLPELATLVAIVVTALVVPFLIPAGLPGLAHSLVLAAATAVVGTEVFVRAWPSVSRRAFEAFSWLGEWELARARELTGGNVPSSKSQAAVWLERRPERREEFALRIEVLLFAGRIEEARHLLGLLAADTPQQRFEIAALRDLIDWQAGGDGDLAGMHEAAMAILPIDGDDRLRAEVSIATAKVRRRMAEGRPNAVEVVEPFLEVRERLGRRANGQIGRALRRRIFPLLLVGSVLVILLGEAIGLSAGPPS